MTRLDGDLRRKVMTKAGGFGDPQLLARLHGQLNPWSECCAMPGKQLVLNLVV